MKLTVSTTPVVRDTPKQLAHVSKTEKGPVFLIRSILVREAWIGDLGYGSVKDGRDGELLFDFPRGFIEDVVRGGYRQWF